MKKLNNEEIKIMADALGMSIQEAQETADIFVKLYKKQPLNMPLDSVDDYIDEWESHWHREANWQEYYEYEKEECMYCYGNTDAEAEEIFRNIETFKNHVSGFSYELSNGLIIVVC